MNDESLAILSNYTQLKSLTLLDCVGTASSLNKSLANFKDLETLNISKLDILPVHFYSVTQTDDLFLTQEHVSEQVVNLGNFSKLKKISLHCVECNLIVFENLKELVIDHCALLHYKVKELFRIFYEFSSIM